jgi:hypothetical protein
MNYLVMYIFILFPTLALSQPANCTFYNEKYLTLMESLDEQQVGQFTNNEFILYNIFMRLQAKGYYFEESSSQILTYTINQESFLAGIQSKRAEADFIVDELFLKLTDKIDYMVNRLSYKKISITLAQNENIILFGKSEKTSWQYNPLEWGWVSMIEDSLANFEDCNNY